MLLGILVLPLLFTVLTPVYLKAQVIESQPLVGIEKKPELTELQKLKAENLKLKVALAQTQATLQDRENKLVSYELSSEQAKLVEEYRKQLNAKENEVFDWEKLVFNLPAAPSTSK